MNNFSLRTPNGTLENEKITEELKDDPLNLGKHTVNTKIEDHCFVKLKNS